MKIKIWCEHFIDNDYESINFFYEIPGWGWATQINDDETFELYKNININVVSDNFYYVYLGEL